MSRSLKQTTQLLAAVSVAHAQHRATYSVGTSYDDGDDDNNEEDYGNRGQGEDEEESPMYASQPPVVASLPRKATSTAPETNVVYSSIDQSDKEEPEEALATAIKKEASATNNAADSQEEVDIINFLKSKQQELRKLEKEKSHLENEKNYLDVLMEDDKDDIPSSKAPEVITKKPEVNAKKPEVVTNAPEVITKKPADTKVPEVMVKDTKKPEVTVKGTKKPEVITKDTKKPEVIVKDTKKPEAITKDTKKPSIKIKTDSMIEKKTTKTIMPVERVVSGVDTATTNIPKKVVPSPTSDDIPHTVNDAFFKDIFGEQAKHVLELPKKQPNMQNPPTSVVTTDVHTIPPPSSTTNIKINGEFTFDPKKAIVDSTDGSLLNSQTKASTMHESLAKDGMITLPTRKVPETATDEKNHMNSSLDNIIASIPQIIDDMKAKLPTDFDATESGESDEKGLFDDLFTEVPPTKKDITRTKNESIDKKKDDMFNLDMPNPFSKKQIDSEKKQKKGVLDMPNPFSSNNDLLKELTFDATKKDKEGKKDKVLFDMPNPFAKKDDKKDAKKDKAIFDMPNPFAKKDDKKDLTKDKEIFDMPNPFAKKDDKKDVTKDKAIFDMPNPFAKKDDKKDVTKDDKKDAKKDKAIFDMPNPFAKKDDKKDVAKDDKKDAKKDKAIFDMPNPFAKKDDKNDSVKEDSTISKDNQKVLNMMNSFTEKKNNEDGDGKKDNKDILDMINPFAKKDAVVQNDNGYVTPIDLTRKINQDKHSLTGDLHTEFKIPADKFNNDKGASNLIKEDYHFDISETTVINKDAPIDTTNTKKGITIVKKEPSNTSSKDVNSKDASKNKEFLSKLHNFESKESTETTEKNARMLSKRKEVLDKLNSYKTNPEVVKKTDVISKKEDSKTAKKDSKATPTFTNDQKLVSNLFESKKTPPASTSVVTTPVIPKPNTEASFLDGVKTTWSKYSKEQASLSEAERARRSRNNIAMGMFVLGFVGSLVCLYTCIKKICCGGSNNNDIDTTRGEYKQVKTNTVTSKPKQAVSTSVYEDESDIEMNVLAANKNSTNDKTSLLHLKNNEEFTDFDFSDIEGGNNDEEVNTVLAMNTVIPLVPTKAPQMTMMKPSSIVGGTNSANNLGKAFILPKFTPTNSNTSDISPSPMGSTKAAALSQPMPSFNSSTPIVPKVVSKVVPQQAPVSITPVVSNTVVTAPLSSISPVSTTTTTTSATTNSPKMPTFTTSKTSSPTLPSVPVLPVVSTINKTSTPPVDDWATEDWSDDGEEKREKYQ